MKKILLAALFTAVALIAAPVTAKADAALDYATQFYNMQNLYLNQQNSYYNTYEVPVMNQYNAAMSAQISQALAATYQAQVLRQQALQRSAVNAMQVNANLIADGTNFGTQILSMADNTVYNTSMNLVAQRQQALQGAANVWGAWMGQYPFPQVP